MKKIISAFMAFVLACNAMLLFGERTAVMAAVIPIDSYFDKTLIDGANNVPVYRGVESSAEDEAFIDFLFDANTGHYRLEYPIADGHTVTFNINKTGANAATVTYTEDPAASAYTVYSGQAGDFVAPADFQNTSTEYYLVSGSTVPSFRITRNTGFSFMVNGKVIRFLWTDTNRMYYTTTGIEKGNIFDFTVSYNRTDPAFPNDSNTSVGKAYVLNRLSDATSRPFSSGGTYSETQLFDWTSYASTAGQRPGQNINHVEISIPLPKIWDAADKTFKPIKSTDLSLATITLELDFKFDQGMTPPAGALKRPVSFGNIFLAVDTADYKAEIVGDSFVVTVKNLDNGLIFNSSYLLFGGRAKGGEIITPRKNDLHPASVYTLLYYDVAVYPENYMLEVNTYYGIPGVYVLRSSVNGGLDRFPEVYRLHSDGTQKTILLPTALRPDSATPTPRQFMIEFIPLSGAGPKPIQSQKLSLTPDLLHLGVGRPSQFKVTDVKMTPVKGGAAGEMDLEYAMTWDIASYKGIASMLAALKSSNPTAPQEIIVYYDLKSVLSPIQPNTTNTYSRLAVRFYYDVNDEGDTFLAADFYEVDAAGAEITNGIIVKAEGVDILSNGLYSTSEIAEQSLIKAYVKIKTSAFKTADPNRAYVYPNLYFLSVKPASITKGDTTETLKLSDSMLDSLTLDDVSPLEVPTAQNVAAKASNATLRSFIGEWTIPMDRIKEYVEAEMPYNYYNVQYNIYMSQSEDKLKAVMTQPSDETNAQAFARRAAATTAVGFDDLNDMNSSIKTSVLPFTGTDSLKITADGKPAIDALRRGDVIKIENMNILEATDLAEMYVEIKKAIDAGIPASWSFTFDGLDSNQRYYFALDIMLMCSDSDVAPFPDGSFRYSKMSSAAAVTTIGPMVTPSPEDKVPPAPFLEKKDTGLSNVTVFWKKIVEEINTTVVPAPDFGVLEYEIIRLKDDQMAAAMLDTKSIDLPALIANNLSGREVIGFRTDGEDISEYKGGAFAKVTDSRYQYTLTAENAEFRDNTLKPNTIYFYYVRTVRIINGNRLYSVWSSISVTSDPVKKPENLIIVREGVTYDAKTQIVIAFDAPVKSTTGLGTDYDIQLSIKRDNADWGTPNIMTASDLLAVTPTPVKIRNADGVEEDYLHFQYIVTGLTHGTSYSFRVRMADNSFGDYSMYSNIATSRTELDQEDYEKEKITDDWMKYLEQQLQLLFQNDYWILEDASTFSAVYRPTMFDGVLLKAANAPIQLPATTANSAVYLIPQSALAAANSQNKGFTATFDGLEIVISPNAINLAQSTAALNAAERIRSKSASDFYLQVTVTRTKLKTGDTVDGREPATPQAEIRLDIVTSKANAKTWDNEIMKMVLDKIASTSTSGGAASTIKSMIESNRPNDEIIRYVDRYIKGILPSMYSDIMKSYTEKRDISYSVHNVSQPLIIRYTKAAADDTVKGYQKEGSVWVNKPLTGSGSTKAINSMVPGQFIFVSYKLSFPGLSDIPDSETLTTIIVKYGLDDYLGRGDTFSASAPVSTHSAAGVAARIGGAAQTANPMDYMRSKGYSVSARSNTTPSSYQETLYLVMAVYEMKTNTKISSLKIRNLTATSGIKGISPGYLKSVQAAFELEIYTDKNMLPTATPTVKDLLQMISRLDKKVKL